MRWSPFSSWSGVRVSWTYRGHDVLGYRHGRPRGADGAAADISLRLAVIGWDGASESSCAVRMLIDADVAGAFTDALRALAEAARDRV